MNSLPWIYNLAIELASRNTLYIPARDRAQSLLYESMHLGRIDRRAVDRVLSLPKDELLQKSTSDLLNEITQTLKSEKIGLVGGSAELYSSADELLSLFSIP